MSPRVRLLETGVPRIAIVQRIVLLGTLALGACRAAPPPVDLAEVLRRHAVAQGGTQALEAVDRMDVELRVEERGLQATLHYRAMRPARARVDVVVDSEVVYSEAYDGSSAWQKSGSQTAPTLSSPEGTEALRRGAIGNLYGLHEFPALGYQLRLLPSEEIDGEWYYPVEVTPPPGGGDAAIHYVSAKTWLVTRQRATNAVHPDADSTRQDLETRHSDFRTVDGITRPFTSVLYDVRTGRAIQRIDLRHVDIHPQFDTTVFNKP